MSEAPRTSVAVLGSTGFIGTAVTRTLLARGIDVRPVAAPRLSWPAGPAATPPARPEVIEALEPELAGAGVVINVAGVANPSVAAGPDLFGANALLPFLVARACASAGVRRFIHVSSIAVQGDGILDETMRLSPSSPYAHSRALGERLLSGVPGGDVVIFRPTSVQGAGRSLTRSLVRLARSPLSCVAGDGSAPTPQILVEDVAEAIAFLARTAKQPPPVVLQPHNGMTTGLLLQLLGGREPRHLPARAARELVRGAGLVAGRHVTAQAHLRRLHMLLFGRRQAPGWLTEQGAVPHLRMDAWTGLRSARPAVPRPVPARSGRP